MIPAMAKELIEVPVRGISSLICHRFSEKAKKQIADKQQKKAKKAKAAKDPKAEYEAAFYQFDDGKRFGIPALAFKKACVAATRYVDDLKMTYVRGCFFIEGEYSKAAGYPLVEITHYDEVVMREDPTTVGMGGKDLRYRPEFRGWRATVQVRLMTDLMSVEQFMNLLDIAGSCVGILEWRPERNGDFGRFEVERGKR